MSRAPKAKAFCHSCDGRMEFGAPFCDACGRPSIWATHEERVAWEVQQWRNVNGSGRQEVHTPIISVRAFRDAQRTPEPTEVAATPAPFVFEEAVVEPPPALVVQPPPVVEPAPVVEPVAASSFAAEPTPELGRALGDISRRLERIEALVARTAGTRFRDWVARNFQLADR